MKEYVEKHAACIAILENVKSIFEPYGTLWNKALDAAVESIVKMNGFEIDGEEVDSVEEVDDFEIQW